ncbi:TPA: peptide ABC transporter substrate-binding protein [Enterococcus faecalis]|nr:peptide ABC transporter substrate-binding protein [Enterococcus faecalis]
MKKTEKILFLGFSALMFILIGCSNKDNLQENKKSSAVEQTANLTAATPIQSLDPATAVDQTSIILLANVMEGLYRLDKKNQAEPALAEKLPDISKDGKIYTISLRKDATWTDKTPVTAEDFVFSWQRVVDPNTASQNVGLFAPIENAEEISKGSKAKESLGIKAVNNHTLQIALKEPTPYFTNLLALPAFLPVNHEFADKHKKDYGTSKDTISTNGAFNLTNLEGLGTSDSWVIEKNTNYWDNKNVSMNTIHFQVIKEINTGVNLYKDGQLDEAPLGGEYAKQHKSDKDYSSSLLATSMYLELNKKTKDSILKNKNLRKSISYAIDRASLVEKLLDNGSIASVGLIPKKLVYDSKTKKDFADQDLVGYDKEKAKKYWENAQKELTAPNNLKLDILVGDGEFEKKAGEFLQNQLQESLKGLTVTVTPVPANAQIEKLSKGDFSISLIGWQAGYADPLSFLANFKTNSPMNYGGYESNEFDILLKDTSDNRLKSLKEAEELLIDDAAIVPIIQTGSSKLINPNLKDIDLHSVGSRYDYRETKKE